MANWFERLFARSDAAATEGVQSVTTFADSALVHLADPGNLPSFLNGMNLDAFLTADFQTRFNTEFWHIAQVARGAMRRLAFENPTLIDTRIMGREDEHNGNTQIKTYIDYKVFGQETVLWTDALIEFDTTWRVDQFPGTVKTSETSPPTFEGLANLVAVLRVDSNNQPLNRDGAALANVTLDNQGRLRTAPPNPLTLRLDPLAGALLRPDGNIFSLVLLELFPRVGPAAPLLGAPLGEDGLPLHNLRMDSRGSFTDLTGAPATLDALTGLPIDGDGKPVRPARLTIPGGGTTDYRFNFSLPVVTDRVTFEFVTRLHLLIMPDMNLVEDLRRVAALRHRLEQSNDYLLSLSDSANKHPHAFGLVYETNALADRSLNQNEVRGLAARLGVLVHFFSIP